MRERHATCPNCGAPVTGSSCPYCGTAHELPLQTMAVGKVATIRFEHEGTLYEMDARIEHFSLDDESIVENFYSFDGEVHPTIVSPDYRVSVSGRVVPAVRHGRRCLWVSPSDWPSPPTLETR